MGWTQWSWRSLPTKSFCEFCEFYKSGPTNHPTWPTGLFRVKVAVRTELRAQAGSQRLSWALSAPCLTAGRVGGTARLLCEAICHVQEGHPGTCLMLTPALAWPGGCSASAKHRWNWGSSAQGILHLYATKSHRDCVCPKRVLASHTLQPASLHPWECTEPGLMHTDIYSLLLRLHQGLHQGQNHKKKHEKHISGVALAQESRLVAQGTSQQVSRGGSTHIRHRLQLPQISQQHFHTDPFCQNLV